MWLAAFFAPATLASLLGLVRVAPRAVPPVSATCAFILTLAALAAAIVR